MSFFSCKRCENYNTRNFNDLKKHIYRKYSCKKTFTSMLLSDDQIIVLTLLPNNVRPEICNEDIDTLKESNLIDCNRDELFKELECIDNNHLKKCKYCNKEFMNKMILKNHIIINCFHTYLTAKVNNVNINITNNITDSVVNYGNFTNNNIININFQLKNPIPFENNWDLSHISEGDKTQIIVSRYMYTKLLEQILENELNLNVIVDKNKNSGLVYKDDINKYCQMKINDIADKTMEKLRNQLHEIRIENTDTIEDILVHSRRIIDKKMIDYEKDDDLKSNVRNRICQEYEKKKKESVKILNNIIKDNKKFEY